MPRTHIVKPTRSVLKDFRNSIGYHSKDRRKLIHAFAIDESDDGEQPYITPEKEALARSLLGIAEPTREEKEATENETDFFNETATHEDFGGDKNFNELVVEK